MIPRKGECEGPEVEADLARPRNVRQVNGLFSHFISDYTLKMLLSVLCLIRAPLFILLLVHPVYVKFNSCLFRLRDFRDEGALSFILLDHVPRSVLIRRVS